MTDREPLPHGPERGSEYLSGNFWNVVRLDDIETSEDEDEDQATTQCTTLDVPEMLQIGPTSPLVLPVLGLAGYLPTSTGFRRQRSDSIGDDSLFARSQHPHPSNSPIDRCPTPNQSCTRPGKHFTRATTAVQPVQPPKTSFAKPRPALPALKSAPVVPSWRRQSIPELENNSPESSQEPSKTRHRVTSWLTETFGDYSWSEPPTPVTPIDPDGQETTDIDDIASSSSSVSGKSQEQGTRIQVQPCKKSQSTTRT